MAYILFIMLMLFISWPIWGTVLDSYMFWVRWITEQGGNRRRAYYEATPWRVMKTMRPRRLNRYAKDMMDDGELIHVRYTIGYERPTFEWWFEMRWNRVG